MFNIKFLKIIDKSTQIVYNKNTVRRLSTDYLFWSDIMGISELRHFVNMSQRDFANFFGMPLGTLRNWEQGISSPPDYVIQMVINSIRRDKMINIETIKFLKMLDELAILSEDGIEEFEHATCESFCNKVYYDSKDDNRVVLEACIIDDPECIHHDIISYYGSNEYSVNVRLDEEGEKFIDVRLFLSDEEIIIENGHWYFS